MTLKISPHRLLIAAFTTMLSLSAAGCGSSGRTPANGPAAVMAVDPCYDVSEEECPARLAYVRKAFNSTVRIHVSRYTREKGMEYAAGTGEVIDARGTVLSAYHVVEDARLVVAAVRHIDDDANVVTNPRDVPMSIVVFNRELDIVLLRPTDAGEKLPEPFTVRRDAPGPGEDLWHFGNVSFWTHGKVIKTNTDFADKHGLTKVGFPCRHGDSGGPFVDLQGRLVGVLLLKDGYIEGRGTTFYLPVGKALDTLEYKP